MPKVFKLDLEQPIRRLGLLAGRTSNRWRVVYMAQATRSRQANASSIKHPIAKKAPKPRREAHRVEIPFPPMKAPFGGPRKYDEDKPGCHTLTLSFDQEATRPELQALRENLMRIEDRLADLVELTSVGNKIEHPFCEDNHNTLIRAGIKIDTFWSDMFPDHVQLKMYLSDVKFKNEHGIELDVDSIEFERVQVQPKVHLREVVCMNNIFYARMIVEECIVYEPAPLHVIGLNMSDMPGMHCESGEQEL